MDVSHKIVTHLPLRELWRGDEFTTTTRRRWLDKSEITELLRVGPVQFVVVDVGARPLWVEIGDCYRFWKDDVKVHLASSQSRVVLTEQPDGYVYFASEWEGEKNQPIVVLEKHH